jgi:hypothetical protein
MNRQDARDQFHRQDATEEQNAKDAMGFAIADWEAPPGGTILKSAFRNLKRLP